MVLEFKKKKKKSLLTYINLPMFSTWIILSRSLHYLSFLPRTDFWIKMTLFVMALSLSISNCMSWWSYNINKIYNFSMFFFSLSAPLSLIRVRLFRMYLDIWCYCIIDAKTWVNQANLEKDLCFSYLPVLIMSQDCCCYFPARPSQILL